MRLRHLSLAAALLLMSSCGADPRKSIEPPRAARSPTAFEDLFDSRDLLTRSCSLAMLLPPEGSTPGLRDLLAVPGSTPGHLPIIQSLGGPACKIVSGGELPSEYHVEIGTVPSSFRFEATITIRGIPQFNAGVTFYVSPGATSGSPEAEAPNAFISWALQVADVEAESARLVSVSSLGKRVLTTPHDTWAWLPDRPYRISIAFMGDRRVVSATVRDLLRDTSTTKERAVEHLPAPGATWGFGVYRREAGTPALRVVLSNVWLRTE